MQNWRQILLFKAQEPKIITLLSILRSLKNVHTTGVTDIYIVDIHVLWCETHCMPRNNAEQVLFFQNNTKQCLTLFFLCIFTTCLFLNLLFYEVSLSKATNHVADLLTKCVHNVAFQK